MSISKIRFISNNRFKIQEAMEILGAIGVTVVPISLKIEELQTTDTLRLIQDKAVKAFEQIGRPLFVEHTGLYLSYINNLPGGLTQIVWDALQADRFTQLFGNTPDTTVIARTTIGYVDGKKIHTFVGETRGRVADHPRGKRDFQWDCIFLPEGEIQTFAEMGSRKNEISMRRKALDEMVAFLKSGGVPKCML